MDAPTVSWPLVKFSRFHSSQQCDERKAVMLVRIISYFPASRRNNLTLHANPHLSKHWDFGQTYFPMFRTSAGNTPALRLLS